MNLDEKVTYFAETDFRNKKTKFGIKNKDRSRHMYVIGMTGMGKSTMLENLAIQDIQSGEGVAFIDPHGGTAEKLLSYVPEHRIKDVVYFAPFDAEYPLSFNVLDDVDANRRHLVVGGLMSAFKKIWVDAWSARMEYILQNILHALLEYPGSTLLGVNRMLSDKDYRKKVVDNITDPSVKAFWVEEYAKYTDKFAAEAAPAIQNKVGQFTGNPLIRNLVGQPKSSFDIRELMDNRKILIMNLSKGRMGEGNSNLIGSMLITKMYLAAMSRADVSESEMKHLPPFNFYVDEFQSFASDSFANILSEARKYKLNLTIAHQYVEQMSEDVKAAVFGNVGSMVVFRVGSTDAEIFEKEFAPFFTLEDIVSLGQRQIYLRLMIDGVGSQPFSATTLPPILPPDVSYKQQVIDYCRATYARKKDIVEQEIRNWHAPISGSGEGVKEKPRFEAPPQSTASYNNKSQSFTSVRPRTESRAFDKPVNRPQPQGVTVPPKSESVTQGHTPSVAIPNVPSAHSRPTPQQSRASQPQPTSSQRVSLSQLLSNTKKADVHIEHTKEKATLRHVVERATDVRSSSVHPSQSKPPVSTSSNTSSQMVGTPQPATQHNAQVTQRPSNEIPTDVLRKLLE